MSQKEIIVGVTGGIAAYKTVDLVSKLSQKNVGVTVVMTSAAREFIGPPTFAALSGRRVITEQHEADHPLGAHIEIARRAELLVVAPATAHFLAQAANGLASDLLSTLYLCFQGRIILAPAMNKEMWGQASVQRNVARLREDGATIVGPGEGWLSCRETGPGRMAEVTEILQACLNG